MNTKLKTGIHVLEGFAGYAGSEYIPSNILLKQWNKAVAGVLVVGVGFYLKEKQFGLHIMSVGIGMTFNGILDGFGMGY